MKADFHMHSLFSDGSETIDRIFEIAEEQGLCALAVTDHESVLGIAQEDAASGRAHLPYVPGVEITALEDGVKFHVLGYGIDPANGALVSYSRDFLDTMNRRSLYQIHMLQQDGIDISEEEFLKKSGPGPLYRAKMLDVLADHDIVPPKKIMRKIGSFFGPGARYEAEDTFCYRDFASVSSMIRNAGGKVVLAHPGRIRRKSQELYERMIVDERLDGLEVYHYQNRPEVREQLLAIARDRGLMITGGTDYHGRYKMDPDLPGDEELTGEVWRSMEPLMVMGGTAN